MRKWIGSGLVLSLLLGSIAPGFAQTSRQKDKNTMRNVGIAAGAAAAYEALHGKGTNALLLGAGAAYAGKKYEDARKAQSAANNHRVGYYRVYKYKGGRRVGYYLYHKGHRGSYHSLRNG
jgi:hypothetical protein